MLPKIEGSESSIVLTARSGRAALFYRLQKLGHTLDHGALESAYQEFLKMADRLQTVEDEHLQELLQFVKVA